MKKKSICIIGLGYVGLPLAIEFGKKREIVGFDIDKERVAQLKKGTDPTFQMTEQQLNKAVNLSYQFLFLKLYDCKFRR